MSTYDYSTLQDLAKTLITKYGRSVTLNKIDRTPDDSNKPWRGPASVTADPADTVDVDAVIMDTISSRYLGLSIQREGNLQADQMLMIVATSAAPTKDLKTFDECLDGSERYAITAINVLKPGDDEIFVAFKMAKKELFS